jgi:site-specific DNA-cytosine methylase
MNIIVFDSGITQPTDKGIVLRDIIEDATTEKEKSYCIDANYHKGSSPENYIDKSRRQLVKVARMVGRKIDENGTRKDYSDIQPKQRLELRPDNKSGCLTGVQKDNCLVIAGYADIKGNDSIKRVYSANGKAPTLTAIQGRNQEAKTTDDGITWRKLTVTECERLQTVNDNYTNHVSNSQRYKMLGNGWTVDVIAHIFKHILKSLIDNHPPVPH